MPMITSVYWNSSLYVTKEAGTCPSGGADWWSAMAGAMHPPCRRGEIRSAPQPPGGDGFAALLCPSSPHRAGRGGGPCFAITWGPRKIEDFVGKGRRNGAGGVFGVSRKRNRAKFLLTQCAVHGGREKTRGAEELPPVPGMSPVRGVVRAGVLDLEESTFFSFRCR